MLTLAGEGPKPGIGDQRPLKRGPFFCDSRKEMDGEIKLTSRRGGGEELTGFQK